jgi:hypothetical protein
MKNSGSGKETVQVVLPLDPNFGFLALKAAIAIDDMLRGERPPLESIGQLAKSLRETTEVGSGSPSWTSFADPLSADMLRGPLEQNGPKPINTVQDLIQRADEVASSLQGAKLGTDKEELERLRDFCLALSQVSSAYRQEERERKTPQYPYRQ